ncbi:hypothetical protein GW937_00370 [Candidatus Kaiserbacteria bacterium]|nr:hypothetical protein [Candidatus Kaiserbacteria bacterium]NCT01967.1 hypothetical protein [Candidatus Parcubacteria bacterium]
MSQKWNLQDIQPAETRKRRTASQESSTLHLAQGRGSEVAQQQDRDTVPSIVVEDGSKKGRNRLLLSVILFFIIVGTAIGLSALTGKTELTIYPEYRKPNVSADFIAYPDKRTGELSYEIMTLEATGEQQVKATGQVEVEELATGMIEITKSTPGAERLIKNTRFRTPEGLIFRIQESVVVPGAVKDQSGSLVPGSIQTKVFADDVGEGYNIPAGKNFDVPGFQESKLTELYTAIKAHNTTAFTGGFKGPQFQIAENDLSTARQALQIQLRDNLLLRIETEKPADFIAFKDSVAITYNQLPAVEYKGDLVTIREQAILQIPLFQLSELGTYLASETDPTFDGGSVRISDPNALTFTYLSSTTSSSVIANEPSLSFRLTGKPLLVSEFDAEKIRKDLAGLPQTALTNVIPAYPGIDEARVHITPFWQRSFPENPDEILIIEALKDKK